jgi:hypothetical protein
MYPLRKCRPIAERFWTKVNKDGPIPKHCPELGPCWLWTGNKDKGGYGLIGKGRAGQGCLQAHRVSWEVNAAPIPEGLKVLHYCDNPPCVNPSHLHLGSYADNNHERNSRGRTARGERMPNAILTDELARKILSEVILRKIGAPGEGGGQNQKRMVGSLRYLAEKYGVSHGGIQAIVERRTWKHVTNPHSTDGEVDI